MQNCVFHPDKLFIVCTLEWQNSPNIILTKTNLPPFSKLDLVKIFLAQFWIVVDTYVIVLVFRIFLPSNIPTRRSWQVKNFGAERTTVLSSSRQKLSLKSEIYGIVCVPCVLLWANTRSKVWQIHICLIFSLNNCVIPETWAWLWR